MNLSHQTYRVLSSGLMIALIASLGLTNFASCCFFNSCDQAEITADFTECCDKQPPVKRSTTELCDSDTCESCNCSVKPATSTSGISLDKAQITQWIVFTVNVIQTRPVPVMTRQEKIRDTEVPGYPFSPLYLLNRVFLN